jgi:hypothetical protein
MSTMSSTEGNNGSAADVRAGPGAQLQVALTSVGLVGVLFAIGALVGWGYGSAAGVALGAALAVANLWVLGKIGAAFLSDASKRRAIWGLAGVVKFAVLAVILFLLIKHQVVHPLALIVGYGALPVGITFAGLAGSRRDQGS